MAEHRALAAYSRATPLHATPSSMDTQTSSMVLNPCASSTWVPALLSLHQPPTTTCNRDLFFPTTARQHPSKPPTPCAQLHTPLAPPSPAARSTPRQPLQHPMAMITNGSSAQPQRTPYCSPCLAPSPSFPAYYEIYQSPPAPPSGAPFALLHLRLTARDDYRAQQPWPNPAHE